MNWIVKNHFSEEVEGMFIRHAFAPHEAQHAEELISAMAKG